MSALRKASYEVFLGNLEASRWHVDHGRAAARVRISYPDWPQDIRAETAFQFDQENSTVHCRFSMKGFGCGVAAAQPFIHALREQAISHDVELVQESSDSVVFLQEVNDFRLFELTPEALNEEVHQLFKCGHLLISSCISIFEDCRKHHAYPPEVSPLLLPPHHLARLCFVGFGAERGSFNA